MGWITFQRLAEEQFSPKGFACSSNDRFNLRPQAAATTVEREVRSFLRATFPSRD